MIDTRSLAVGPIRDFAAKLLKLRSPLPVRVLKEGDQHFVRALLFSLGHNTGQIKPPHHKGTETVALNRIHLWPSAICSGPKPICTSQEFDDVMKPLSRKAAPMLQTSTESRQYVIIDRGYSQFYQGPGKATAHPFSTDLARAKIYTEQELGGARKSIGKIKKSARIMAFVSESGLELIKVTEALQILRLKKKSQASGTAAQATVAVPQPPDNGHTNGNGKDHGKVAAFDSILTSRLSEHFQEDAVPIQPMLSFAKLGLDVSMDLANLPSFDQAQVNLERAYKDVEESQQMLSNALQSLQTAQREQLLVSRLHAIAPAKMLDYMVSQVMVLVQKKLSEFPPMTPTAKPEVEFAEPVAPREERSLVASEADR